MTTTLLDGDALYEAISCNPGAAGVPDLFDAKRVALPAELDFPPAARAAAFRHAADWVESGAPLGVQHALFQDLRDADTDELLHVQRCAIGEAMLYLMPDDRQWRGVPPQNALLRDDEPDVCYDLLIHVHQSFDSPDECRWDECARALRCIAERIEPALVPA